MAATLEAVYRGFCRTLSLGSRQLLLQVNSKSEKPLLNLYGRTSCPSPCQFCENTDKGRRMCQWKIEAKQSMGQQGGYARDCVSGSLVPHTAQLAGCQRGAQQGGHLRFGEMCENKQKPQ